MAASPSMRLMLFFQVFPLLCHKSLIMDCLDRYWWFSLRPTEFKSGTLGAKAPRVTGCPMSAVLVFVGGRKTARTGIAASKQSVETTS